jgi:hypothetical protein
MQNRKFRGRGLGRRDRYRPLNVILQLCLRATYEAGSNPRNLVGSAMTLMAFWYCLIAAGLEICRPMPQLDLAALAFALTASICAFASSLQVF